MVENSESSDVVKEVEEEEVVMDTPARTKSDKINENKFEESPVFNFLNSLSPLKPVKPSHMSQTINSLNFSSIPSIFTSPHVATLKESRFLRRNQLGDPSKPEFSSDDLSKDDITDKKADATHENKENISPGCPIEVFNEPPNECLRSLNYNFGSPSIDQMTPCVFRTNPESETDGSSSALGPIVQNGCGSMFHETEMSLEGPTQIDQNVERSGCEWDSLISDTADLFNFDSQNDKEVMNEVVYAATRFYQLASNDIRSSQVLVGPSGQDGEGYDPENQFTQSVDGSKVNKFNANLNISGVSSQSINAINGGTLDSLVHEHVSNLNNGMRRRCLVFELPGTSKKNVPENSNSDSPILPQFDGNCMTNDKQAIPAMFRNESSLSILPGIGLHLNSLAATSKDYNVVKNESCTSGKQLVIANGSVSNHQLLNSSQDSLRKAIDVTQSDRQSVLVDSGHSIPEDGGHASNYVGNEESNQATPKKKRRRSESGDGEGCKRCNCKKSKCLKLYCECFAAGLYCVEPCSCIECFNTPSHEDTVLATRKQIESRNPLAFAPKVISTSNPLSGAGDDSSKTPASSRHKRGCNCKKSGCLKKYCECYQGGVGCSINCRCEGCKNAFGRKDGSEMVLEEVDAMQKSLIDVSQPGSLIPVPFSRPMRHLPYPSKNKPPRSTFLNVGSSSAVYPSQGLARPDFYPPPSKFDNNFGLLQEEDIPSALQTNCTPISGIKSLSPNGKRVSPPHPVRDTSRSQRSSRKLILQSIPSFPSLTPKNET
ncbi:hypothetical protein Leryth_024907 [Lithospermum erythrorhizon]|uniref:CRC domain-containing protein n=1 Tax=Lithospermum erythrorhizon TaxID=34254 RepID=A0AAV3PPV1_LITER|nr:hypothetical protein Leryth_024907 [Lithospermum erythrorhizon]